MVRDLVILLVLALGTLTASASDDWNYDDKGPTTWYLEYPNCALKSQSPVTIDTASARYNSSLANLKLNKWDTALTWNVTYGEFALDVTPEPAVKLSISGGGLGDEFFLNSFHFHWSEASGSEHMINGNSYAAEMHFVHTSNLGKQAILGFLLEFSSADDNAKIAPLINLISGLNGANRSGSLRFSVASLLLGSNDTSSLVDDGFYRYQGSLTLPPCTEGKVWTVFKRTIKISQSQMDAFRRGKIVRNNRPIQSLNNRIVYTNKPNSAATNQRRILDSPVFNVFSFMIMAALTFNANKF